MPYLIHYPLASIAYTSSTTSRPCSVCVFLVLHPTHTLSSHHIKQLSMADTPQSASALSPQSYGGDTQPLPEPSHSSNGGGENIARLNSFVGFERWVEGVSHLQMESSDWLNIHLYSITKQIGMAHTTLSLLRCSICWLQCSSLFSSTACPVRVDALDHPRLLGWFYLSLLDGLCWLIGYWLLTADDWLPHLSLSVSVILSLSLPSVPYTLTYFNIQPWTLL